MNQQSSTNYDKIVTVLKSYLNYLKEYLTTFQVVILCKPSCRSTYYNSKYCKSIYCNR